MEQDLPPRPLAVYLHIPFCLSRCGYCSFFSLPYSRSALADYLAHLRREIALFSHAGRIKPSSIYLGGGTPSLLPAGEITALCGLFDIEPEAEISLEINPLQITEAYLAELSKTRVNRLSLGVQSMDDAELAWLDRRHKASQIPDKVWLCRRFGFTNLSLDLMYGLPGSDRDSVAYILDQYIALAPEHISCYLLTLDEDSALGAELGHGTGQPDDDELALQYEVIREKLAKAGFEQYEVSNFCRPGYASRHNLSYWESRPYLGLGASAAGWLPPFRYTNPADLAAYYRLVDAGKLMPETEKCSPEQERADYIMMGLRLLKGIDLDEVKHRFGVDILAGEKASSLLNSGYLELLGSRLRVAPKALFVSNAIIGELL
jgi:oxygen-independent coproporphyrinogen-3 oxidase